MPTKSPKPAKNKRIPPHHLKAFLSEMKQVLPENYHRDSRPVELAQREQQALMMQLKVKEYSDTLRMRTQWSYFLMGAVALSIIFQITLILLVGSKLLMFADEWLARLLFPGIFGEILGLVYIIIRYLFPEKIKHPEDPGEKNSTPPKT